MNMKYIFIYVEEKEPEPQPLLEKKKRTFERGEREAEREFLRTAGSNLTRDSNSKPRLDEFARNS